MARKRMLSPDVWNDPVLGQLTFRQRLLYIGLKSYSDDEGRFRVHPALIKSFVFPFDHDLSLADVESDISLLAEKHLIETWSIEGQDYGCLPDWHIEQKVQYPTASRIPPPPRTIVGPALLSTPGAVPTKQTGAVQSNLLPMPTGITAAGAVPPPTTSAVPPEQSTLDEQFMEDSMSLHGGLNEDSPVGQSSLGQVSLRGVKSGQSRAASGDDGTDETGTGACATTGTGTETCAFCDGTGWEYTDGKSVKKCRCRTGGQVEIERVYWTLSPDDIGGFQSKEVREAYARLTGNQTSKRDRDQIELTGADYPFSSRAIVMLMEIIKSRKDEEIKSFAYFRAGITEVWKRCVDAEDNAVRMSVGVSAEKRRELILTAVRREIGQWTRRVA